MFHRNRFELEYKDIYEKYGLGTTIWAPLASGLLTGRYLSDEKEEGRMNFMPEFIKETRHFS